MTEAIVLHRLGEAESKIEIVMQTQASVAESLQKLVVLETHHAQTREQMERAFNALSRHNDRITKLEVKQPTLDLTARAVGMFVIAAVAAVIALVWNYAISQNHVTHAQRAAQESAQPK